MKRSPMRAACAASLACLTLLIAGCGGGNGAAPVTTTDPVDLGGNDGSGSNGSPLGGSTLSVQGRVLNVGYVANTLVCADIDNDGACGPDEPSTTTEADGHYALTVPVGVRGVHLLAQLRPSSVDTAYPVNGVGDPSIAQGWTLVAPLEYPLGATSAQANISVLTSTYLMRLANQGHYRLINSLAVLVRAGKTDDLTVPIDFDYAATPPAGLAPSLKRLCDYLSTRAAAAGAPAPLVDTMGVLQAWYGTYNAATRPIMDVTGFTGNTPAAIAANIDGFSYRNYTTRNSLAADLREYMVDKGGFVRVDDQIQTLISQGYILAGGQYDRVFQNWIGGVWSDTSYPDPEYLTLTPSGDVAYLSAEDPLQPRNILAADGNAIVYDTAVSGVRYRMDLDDNIFHGFHLYDWGKNQNQLTTASYGYTQVPATRPTCASDYNTGAVITSTNPDDWFTACVTYFLYEHIGGLVGYHTVEDPQARSLFYDETLLDPLVKFPLAHPLIADCAADGRATVQVMGHATCNTMTGDARNDHVAAELFDPAGIVIESWTTADPAFAPAIVPIQLRLVLQADGSGTIAGPVGASQLVENVQWTRDTANPAVVLVTWTPPIAGQAMPQLPVHFANADFSSTPSMPASPRFNHVAIVLQDGVFLSGEAYDVGYTNNFTSDIYKRMNRRALEISGAMLNEIVGKMYREGGFR